MVILGSFGGKREEEQRGCAWMILNLGLDDRSYWNVEAVIKIIIINFNHETIPINNITSLIKF